MSMYPNISGSMFYSKSTDLLIVLLWWPTNSLILSPLWRQSFLRSSETLEVLPFTSTEIATPIFLKKISELAIFLGVGFGWFVATFVVKNTPICKVFFLRFLILFYAKFLFCICTGGNGFWLVVHAFSLIMESQWSVFNENHESANPSRLCYYWLKKAAFKTLI